LDLLHPEHQAAYQRSANQHDRGQHNRQLGGDATRLGSKK
jgi:hypothetical protein